MKIFIYFVIINIYLSLNFKPIPKGNGKLNSLYAHKSTNNLYFIFEHFRHGARSPCNGGFVNKTDDLGGKWTDYGSLTKVGIKQHYNLGIRNRKYYDGFISREYIPEEIKVYCSYYNRTIMSAQAQLLGFYNTMSFDHIKKNDDIIGEEKIINKANLHSIIPPINLFENKLKGNKEIFEIVFGEKFKCPLHIEMTNKNIKHINEIKAFNKLNSIKGDINNKYFEIISREFNIGAYTMDWPGMIKFCDIFICNYFDDGHNKQRLLNLEKKFKTFNSTDIVEKCYDFFSEKFFTVDGTEYANKSTLFIMSKLMKRMINFMESRIKLNDQNYLSYESPKFVLYSGHDDTLTQMQLFLHKFFNVNLEWIPFASNQIYEIRKYGNVFYIEVYYNERLKMNITFNQFSEIINKSIMSEEEINQKCYGNTRSPYFLRILILCILLLILVISYILTKLYYSNFYKKYKSEKIPKEILIA